MKLFEHFFRLLHISVVLIKHGLDDILLCTPFGRPVRLLLWFTPIRRHKGAQKSRGIRIREALEELGPIFVKFGQILSTRPDVIAADIINELEKLETESQNDN